MRLLTLSIALMGTLSIVSASPTGSNSHVEVTRRSNSCTAGTAPGTNCQIVCGVDHAGGDYAQQSVYGIQECATMCYQDERCTDAQYEASTSYCYLKNHLTQASSNSNVDSIICRKTPTVTTTTTTVTTATSTSTPLQCNPQEADEGSSDNGGCSSNCYCISDNNNENAYCAGTSSGSACQTDADCSPDEFCVASNGFDSPFCSNSAGCTSTYPQKRDLFALAHGPEFYGNRRSRK